MESLAMKENHLPAIYGWIFVIVLNAEKKKLLRKTIQEDRRKNPLNKSLEKDTKQVIQKLTSLENPMENLTIMFFILELKSKNSFIFLHAKNPVQRRPWPKP